MSVFFKTRTDGSKAWFFRFTHNGKRHCRVGGTTKTEALRAQEKFRSELLTGEFELKDRIKNPSINEFAAKFLERRKGNRSYGRDIILTNHLLRRYHGKKLSEIHAQDVEDYKDWRRAEGVKNATINRELACLKHMYNQAISWGDTRENPCRHVKLLHEPPKKDRYVTKEEARKLIEAASDNFRPILITVFNTGMRKQEILGLKWENIRLWDCGGEIELVNTKSGKKRHVPLNSDMRALLSGLDRKNEYVFPGTHCKRLLSIFKPLRSAIRKAGIEPATFHDFRHSFASLLSEAGEDVYTIMEIGGWSDLRTLTRYLHRTRAKRQAAIEKLNGTTRGHLSATSASIVKLKGAVNA